MDTDKLYHAIQATRQVVADAVSDYTTRGETPPYQVLKASDVLTKAANDIWQLLDELDAEAMTPGQVADSLHERQAFTD